MWSVDHIFFAASSLYEQLFILFQRIISASYCDGTLDKFFNTVGELPCIQ